MFEEKLREFDQMPTTMLIYFYKKIGLMVEDRATINPTFYRECEKEAEKIE